MAKVRKIRSFYWSTLMFLHDLVYSFGSGEKGQLGNGRTGEHITTGNRTAFDIQYEPSTVESLLYTKPGSYRSKSLQRCCGVSKARRSCKFPRVSNIVSCLIQPGKEFFTRFTSFISHNFVGLYTYLDIMGIVVLDCKQYAVWYQ